MHYNAYLLWSLIWENIGFTFVWYLQGFLQYLFGVNKVFPFMVFLF